MKTSFKPSIWEKIRGWSANHKKTLVVILVVAVFIGLSAFALSIFIREPNDGTNDDLSVNFAEKTKPIPVIYYSKLTGLQVQNEAALVKPVTAVMIENSPEARPQSGLKDAEIVFEAIAEGGITRFMALYQNAEADLIGPVRSVRIYYATWLAGFDASIAHCGGSEEALAEVRNGNYRDIDQYFNDTYYWRADDRYAPHNLYTSLDRLNELNAVKGYTESNFAGFSHIDGKPAETLDATNISVNISGYLFNSTYAYSAEANTYLRSQSSEAHLDREKGQISPSVVVAMHVDEYTLADGHESIENIGSGSATIFQNGTATNVTWTKDDKTSTAAIHISIVEPNRFDVVEDFVHLR